MLDVIDTGAGMPDDVQMKIFDPFYSTRPGGSGLGLPTTRKIIEAHGGTIEVDSLPGKGSRFSIRLPEPANLGDSRRSCLPTCENSLPLSIIAA